MIRGELHPWIPGPGDVNPRPRPGALHDYFAGVSDSIDAALMAEDPKEHPEWFNRDARLEVMDEQGVEAVWMFPSQGVCMEGPMQPDVEAILDIFHAFNHWIDDEWGFAHKDRIFAAPYLTLSDLDSALGELEWVLDRGARVVALRPGPVFTPEGWKSPADPAFDPFWARVEEARLVVATHPGFDDGYRDVEDALARSWGYESRRRQGPVSSLNFYEPFVDAVMHDRLIHDFMVAVVAHGLFERHPRLRLASIENGLGGYRTHSLRCDGSTVRAGVLSRAIQSSSFASTCGSHPSSAMPCQRCWNTCQLSGSSSGRTGPTPRAWLTRSSTSTNLSRSRRRAAQDHARQRL